MRDRGAARWLAEALVVLGETLRDATLGIAAGIALALVAGRIAAASLFDTAVWDPAVLAASALLLACVATLAALVPARRAARTDPMRTLRQG